MYYVYILKGDKPIRGNKQHYIGYTSNIQKRLDQHLHGGTQTTRIMSNIHLLGYFTKETKREAIVLERRIKKDGHITNRVNHPDFVHLS